MSKFIQGIYKLKNQGKYVGDPNNIVFRSSWELKLLQWLDLNNNILRFASEEVIIPYVSPVDGKVHRYFPDFAIEYKTVTGEIKRAILEVKPECQTRMPHKPKRQTKRYLTEVQTYAVNLAKADAARKWCIENNFTFNVITEYDLGIKHR